MKRAVYGITAWIFCIYMFCPATVRAGTQASFGIQNDTVKFGLKNSFELSDERYEMLLFAGAEYDNGRVWVPIYEHLYEAEELAAEYLGTPAVIEDVPRAEALAVKLFGEKLSGKAGAEWEVCLELLESRRSFSETSFRITILEADGDKEDETEAADKWKIPGPLEGQTSGQLELQIDNEEYHGQEIYILADGTDGTILPLTLAAELYGYEALIEDSIVKIDGAEGLFSAAPILFFCEHENEDGLVLRECLLYATLNHAAEEEADETDLRGGEEAGSSVRYEKETEQENGEESETKTERESGEEPETKTEQESGEEPETKTIVETGEETSVKTETRREAGTTTETKSEAEAETRIETKSEADAETERECLPEEGDEKSETGTGASPRSEAVNETANTAVMRILWFAMGVICGGAFYPVRKRWYAGKSTMTGREGADFPGQEEPPDSNMSQDPNAFRVMNTPADVNLSRKLNEASAMNEPKPRKMSVRCVAVSNKGLVRGNNEDNFCFNGEYMKRGRMDEGAFLSAECKENVQLYAVCDGMGGADAGEEASHRAAKELALQKSLCQQMMTERELTSVLCDISEKIYEEARQKKQKSGTTAALMLLGRSQAVLVNVGDSRIYRLREEKLLQISVDHSKVQRMINMGLLTAEQAKTDPERHVITQYLGMPPEVKVSPYCVTEREICDRDIWLLCSDGLTDMVEDSRIERILREEEDLDEAARELLRTALKNGGRDNVTMILIRIMYS